jgi:hypothetical protein
MPQDPPAPQSQDPIPQDCIGIGEAFWEIEAHLREAPNTADNLLSPYWHKLALQSLELQKPHCSPAELEEIHRLRSASLILREQLELRRLSAFIRDPDTGERLRMQQQGWFAEEWHGQIIEPHWLNSNYLAPFECYSGETVSHWSFGAAGSVLRGYSRPVFLEIEQFREWLKNNFGTVDTPKPRRKSGYEQADATIIKQMYELVQSGKVRSVEDAAKRFAQEALGRSLFESKVTRLAKRYRQTYPY